MVPILRGSPLLSPIANRELYSQNWHFHLIAGSPLILIHASSPEVREKVASPTSMLSLFIGTPLTLSLTVS